MTRRSLGSRSSRKSHKLLIRCVANDSPAGMLYTTASLPGTAIIVEFITQPPRSWGFVPRSAGVEYVRSGDGAPS